MPARERAERVAHWKLFNSIPDSPKDLTRAQKSAAIDSLHASDQVLKSGAYALNMGPYAKRASGLTFAYFNSGFPYHYIVEFDGVSSHVLRAGYYTREGVPLAGNPWLKYESKFR